MVALENKRTLNGDLTVKQWVDILNAYNRRCGYCDKPGRIVIEHIKPVRAGGETTARNVLPACHVCNYEKGPKLLDKWLGPNSAKAIIARHQKLVDGTEKTAA